jgi:hypothetical protein
LLDVGSSPTWGAKFQNPSLDSKPSTVGLFIGIGVTPSGENAEIG